MTYFYLYYLFCLLTVFWSSSVYFYLHSSFHLSPHLYSFLLEKYFQATIDSLQNIVNQKEETIGRYQQLLKEGRDEHSQAAARLQEELRSVQTALNNLQQSYNRWEGSMGRKCE